MKKIIRQLNLHFEKDGVDKKVSFQTIYDDVKEIKQYLVIYPDFTIEVSKEQGNQMYKQLKQQNPKCKALIVINC